MYDLFEDILNEPNDDMNGTNARTLAKADLFTFDHKSPILNRKMTDAFHRRTVRLISAAERARLDIQVAVAYLCTRETSSNQSDYTKLT